MSTEAENTKRYFDEFGPDKEVPASVYLVLQAERDRLRAALEGLHFHHKVFEPDCRYCQAAHKEVFGG